MAGMTTLKWQAPVGGWGLGAGRPGAGGRGGSPDLLLYLNVGGGVIGFSFRKVKHVDDGVACIIYAALP